MTTLVNERDSRTPMVRLPRLLDKDSLTLLHDVDDTAVTMVRGEINGDKVIAFCTDATVKGGALGMAECLRIRDAIDLALAEGVPVIGLWHSGGAKLADGVESMDGIGQIFASMVRASGRIPQISVVLGPAAGGAAYGPALTDIVVQAPGGRVFITGPDVIRSVTGETIDMASLGGLEAHSRKSGVTHVPADSEEDAYHRTRLLVALLTRPGNFDPSRAGARVDLRTLLPESPARAYPVRPLLTALLDDGDLQELQPKWAANMLVGLGRLGGGTVGIVANNPLRKGGCLDSAAAEKASRFVRMCDGFGVPLLVVVDVPGYLPGVSQEWGGVVRRGAKLLYAFAEATVPRVTLITRKSYGGAYIAMNSRALGATSVLAWPGAEVAVMSAEAAVGILHRKEIAAAEESGRVELVSRLVEKHRHIAGGLGRALDLGVIDEVVDPEETRPRLISIFETATGSLRRRGTHGNIPL